LKRTIRRTDVATFNGTPSANIITPTLVSSGVVANPLLSKPGAGADTLWGFGGADSLDGGGGNDLLDGGAGNDTLLGGDGADSMRGGAGNDSLLGGLGADTLDGGDGDNTLRGGDGDDRLISATNYSSPENEETSTLIAKTDTLDGGAGNDRFVFYGRGYFWTPGRVSAWVDGGTGTDTVELISFAAGIVLDATARFTNIERIVVNFVPVELAAGENLCLFGTAAANTLDFRTYQIVGSTAFVEGLVVFGLAGNDFIAGGASGLIDDHLSGGEGADTLLGGAGNDLLEGNRLYDFKPDVANLLNGGIGNDTIIGSAKFDTLRGGEGDDVLTSYGSSLTLFEGSLLDGGAGNDTLRSVAPADTLSGGDGDDLLLLESPGTFTAVVNGGAGDDRIEFEYDSGVPKDLSLAQIDGGLGVDTLVLYELPEGFEDYVPTPILLSGSAQLVGVERFETDGDFGDRDIVGTEAANLFDFSSFQVLDGDGDTNNLVVSAGGGNDTLRATNTDTTGDVLNGDAGDDRIFGGIGRDFLSGDDGADTIEGGMGPDELRGGAGSDWLVGGADFDILDGGLGSDTLSGGAGADWFVFYYTDVSAPGAADVILDFEGPGAAAGDLINVFSIDANIFARDNNAFTFGSTGIGGLWVANASRGADTIVFGNTDFDAKAELVIVIRDGAAVTASAYTAADFGL
jgi:Ca2+-binding RTX toxin-like protein